MNSHQPLHLIFRLLPHLQLRLLRQRPRQSQQLRQREFSPLQQPLDFAPHEGDFFLSPLGRGDGGAVQLRQRGAERDDGAARGLRGDVPGGAAQLEVGERGETGEEGAERDEGSGGDVEGGDVGEGEGVEGSGIDGGIIGRVINGSVVDGRSSWSIL